MIDTHSHILPGVDDGARTIEDSLGMIEGLAKQGVTDIIATPHYMLETTFMHSKHQNQLTLDNLKGELKKRGISVNLHLGNEIYISKSILELVKNGDISTLAGSNYLLIELPLSGEYANREDIFQEIINAGYHVVLAHPERYTFFQDNYTLLDDLAEMGVLFQCNIGSILGQYGTEAQKMVSYMAKEGLIFMFGSDIHRPRKGNEIVLAQKKLRKVMNERAMIQAFVVNPRKIIYSGL